MIDIRSCKEPSYGGLMVALDMAVTFDALQRLPLLENDVLGKRKTTLPAQGCRSKRRKTSTTRILPSIKVHPVFVTCSYQSSPISPGFDRYRSVHFLWSQSSFDTTPSTHPLLFFCFRLEPSRNDVTCLESISASLPTRASVWEL